MSDTNTDRVLYEHTQRAWGTMVGLAAGLATQIGAAVRGVRAGRKRGWSYLPGMLSFVFGMVAVSSLTVTVRRGELEAAFPGGLFRRRVDLTRVESARVVTVPWYYGWGMRFTPHGLLYSVWGRCAVELTLPGGRRFTVGSDEPYLLLSAIEQARRAAAV